MKALSKIQIEVHNRIFKSNLNGLVLIFKESSDLRNSKSQELIKELEKWSAENTGKKADEMVMFSGEKLEAYNHYKYDFDYLLMNALFISAFSLFEVHFKRLAAIAENGLGSKIKLTDIKGNGEIDTTRKYLYLIHNISEAKAEVNEWNELLQFKAIRNAIVHHGSILNYQRSSQPEKLIGYKKLIQHNIWIQPSDIYFKIKSLSFLEDFRDVCLEYIEKTTEDLLKK